jgi:hypothetical protein
MDLGIKTMEGVRGQKSEDRGQRAEVRGQMSDGRIQTTVYSKHKVISRALTSSGLWERLLAAI